MQRIKIRWNVLYLFTKKHHMKKKNSSSIKTLTKSNVWEIQENDVFRLFTAAEKDADTKENLPHYFEVMRSAFDMEEVKDDKPEALKKYKDRGFKVGTIRIDESTKQKWAVKKKPIVYVTDLNYQNIRHITAAKLIDVLEHNFGGGWESLPQNVRDIIESGFEISTTTLPKERLHKPGNLYEKKTKDGFTALEIPKGTWVEAIFVKEKPQNEKIASNEGDEERKEKARMRRNRITGDDDEVEELDDNFDDEDEEMDEERQIEESYRTTFEEDPEDLDLDVDSITDDEEDY